MRMGDDCYHGSFFAFPLILSTSTPIQKCILFYYPIYSYIINETVFESRSIIAATYIWLLGCCTDHVVMRHYNYFNNIDKS